jgi:hypothetical protein
MPKDCIGTIPMAPNARKPLGVDTLYWHGRTQFRWFKARRLPSAHSEALKSHGGVCLAGAASVVGERG